MIDTEELLAELRRLADGNDPPSKAEMEEEGEYSAMTYHRRFGSWAEACHEAGFTPREQRVPEDDLLAELRRLADGDTALSKVEMNEAGEYAASTYEQRFESWTEACREADLTPREQRVPEDDLLAELRRLADGNDPPTAKEMDREGQYAVSTYQKRFETWNEACRAADLTPREQRIPKDDLLTELRRLADGDTGPTKVEMNDTGEYDASTYHRRFGSWSEACRAAGLTFREQRVPEDDLLAELHRLADGDTAPSKVEMNEEGEYAASTYQNRFESWSEACRAAGLMPRSQGGTLSDDDLLAELRRLADGDVPPTVTEMNEDGEYSAQTFYDRFGSWPDACEAAGLTPGNEASDE